MKFILIFATILFSSLILAPSTDASVCSRLSARREARAERRANRYELRLGDRIGIIRFRLLGNSGC